MRMILNKCSHDRLRKRVPAKAFGNFSDWLTPLDTTLLVTSLTCLCLWVHENGGRTMRASRLAHFQFHRQPRLFHPYNQRGSWIGRSGRVMSNCGPPVQHHVRVAQCSFLLLSGALKYTTAGFADAMGSQSQGSFHEIRTPKAQQLNALA